MDKSNKWIIGIIAAVVIVWAVVAATKQPAPAPTGTEGTGQTVNLTEPVKIGIMLPLTGDGAAYGVPIQKAALMAQEEINAAGGIGGQQVELVTEDDKCETAAGVAAAQKLINNDKLSIVFGSACSGATLAAAPIAEEARTLLVSPAATNPDISTAGDYIFRTCPSDAGQGAVGAEYAYNRMNARKAAVISEQTDYAQGLRKVFVSRFNNPAEFPGLAQG